MVDIEEIRRQRLQENKRKLEELGLPEGSKALAAAVGSKKKSQQRTSKPKAKSAITMELRRSSRPRNLVQSYSDDANIDLPPLRKRSRSTSSSPWVSYIARPLDEIKVASSEERDRATRAAEGFQNNLKSGNPSFVKSMVRSHVYNCFWLGLPSKFCEDHLSKTPRDVILEDEDGMSYDAVYIENRKGLSGGWRGFALTHKLDDGDAVVFELVGANKFKIYIFRTSLASNEKSEEDIVTEKKTRRDMKHDTHSKKKNVTKGKDNLVDREALQEDAISEEQKSEDVSQKQEKKTRRNARNDTHSKKKSVINVKNDLADKELVQQNMMHGERKSEDVPQKLEKTTRSNVKNNTRSKNKNVTEKNGLNKQNAIDGDLKSEGASQEPEKKGKSKSVHKTKKEESIKDEEKCVSLKPKKARAPRPFFRRV